MRIERIKIAGFGCLRDKEYVFPEGRAALILEDNESGKSTLAAAILAGLCGMPKRKLPGEKLKLLDAFKPWNGENYAVELDIEAGGEKYRIERDFAKDGFVVRDLATNRDITAECSRDLAEQFLKLSREDFARLAFMAGKDLHQFSSNAGIRDRLAAAVEGSDESAGGDIAISTLENLKYGSIKPENALKRITEGIISRQEELQSLNDSLDAAGENASRLDIVRKQYSDLSDRLDELDGEYRSARLREVREQISLFEMNSEEVEQLEAELYALEAYSTFPIERKTQLNNALTRADGLKKQTDELVKRREELTREADDIAYRLESLKQYDAADENEPANLLACANAIAEAQKALAARCAELNAEKRALSAEGINVDAFDKIWGRIQNLGSADIEYVRRFRERDLEAENKTIEAERTASECASRLKAIFCARASTRQIGAALLGLGVLFGAAGIILVVLRTIGMSIGAAITLAGALIAAFGGVKLASHNGISADEKARLDREISDAQSLIERTRADRETALAKLKSIAHSLESDPESLLSTFNDSQQALHRSDRLKLFASRADDDEKRLGAAVEKAQSALGRLGVTVNKADETLEALTRTQQTLAKYFSDRTKLRQLNKDISSADEQIRIAHAGSKEEEKIAREILTDAGIDRLLQLDEAVQKFGEMEGHYLRYREIKEALLPAASKHVAADESMEKLLAEERDLVSQGAEAFWKCEFRTTSAIDGNRQGTRAEFDTLSAEIRELEKSVGACVDNYRRRYPVAKEQLEKLQAEWEKVSRFREAIELAAKTLRETSRDSRKRWAAALNTRASEILPHLNEDYDTLLFDDSLSFTIRHIPENRIIDNDNVDACLSTGAKDQVYLAVRLACCCELSRLSEPLPIILDDPLMAADDIRFRSAFSFLAGEFAKDQQVIILSCHRARHEGAAVSFEL